MEGQGRGGQTEVVGLNQGNGKGAGEGTDGREPSKIEQQYVQESRLRERR